MVAIAPPTETLSNSCPRDTNVLSREHCSNESRGDIVSPLWAKGAPTSNPRLVTGVQARLLQPHEVVEGIGTCGWQCPATQVGLEIAATGACPDLNVNTDNQRYSWKLFLAGGFWTQHELQIQTNKDVTQTTHTKPNENHISLNRPKPPRPMNN